MCGIAGVLTADQTDRNEDLARGMIGALAHRGPDGIRVETLGADVLAHARLSIIDLEGGWQPLHAAGSTLVGNGEIYNYLELIDAFGLQDRLATGSDFEPLLHLYAQEGERAFERLRGMYAFCLVGADGRAWLVRDAFGIKPLYVRTEGARLLFASERRALWRTGGLTPALDLIRASQLLTLNYVLEDGADCSGIARVPPGAVVEVTKGVPAWPPVRRPVVPPARPARTADAAAVSQLDAVLEDAVRVHQRSDVPYGLFLSGGVDSTTLAVLMARLSQRPVKAFTCGFDAPGVADERRAAERVARALDLDWRETTFSEDDFWRLAPECASALDDPTTDYACLPTLKLAEAAKRDLRVVLSGEGGDEMFGGYGRYRRALRPEWLGGRPSEPQIDARFLRPEAAAGAGPSPLEAWRRKARCGESNRLSPLQRAQLADVATWLPDDLLLKLDRCLMAHGLEGRTPFLDREVARFAFDLPDRQKVRGGYGKWILRRWLETACPAAEPWAKKRGFTVPVGGWIAPRAADLGPRIAACQGIRNVCDPSAVSRVFSDPAQASTRWPLLFYALWWTIHVEGLSALDAGRVICGD